MDPKIVDGFSKLSKSDKISWLLKNYLADNADNRLKFEQFWINDDDQQQTFDGFSENVISNHILPYSVAPNFLVNGRVYAIPMVIEESSVVAAASSAAKFWLSRGGFHSEVISTTKLGHLHFRWTGDPMVFTTHGEQILKVLKEDVSPLSASMEARGGGVISLKFKDLSHKVDHIYQIEVSFETCDSMGANFINTILEQLGVSLKSVFETLGFSDTYRGRLEIIMAILSNYTPLCIVRSWVTCSIQELDPTMTHQSTEHLAKRFKTAVDIAIEDPYRAVTHNKGIFNGVDALVLATGNDFRAIEACGHAYAARDGQYRSLSHCSIEDDVFTFELTMPIACGTVGGLTKLHPLSKMSLEILGQPSAPELMQLICTLGLAQNFAAVKSLVTTGIQKGHMKMHLTNILKHLGVNEEKAMLAREYFADKTVSYSAVRSFIESE